MVFFGMGFGALATMHERLHSSHCREEGFLLLLLLMMLLTLLMLFVLTWNKKIFLYCDIVGVRWCAVQWPTPFKQERNESRGVFWQRAPSLLTSRCPEDKTFHVDVTHGSNTNKGLISEMHTLPKTHLHALRPRSLLSCTSNKAGVSIRVHLKCDLFCS